MPLTSKGSKILSSMQSQYGAKKGKNVFYASINAGKIKGAEGRAEGGKVKEDAQAQEELIAAAGALAEDSPVMRALRLPLGKPTKKKTDVVSKQGGGKIDDEEKLRRRNTWPWQDVVGDRSPRLPIPEWHSGDKTKEPSMFNRRPDLRADGGKISSEFRLPWAARTAMYGLRPNRSKPLIGPTPGRADKRPENVESGSYVIPSDVVAAIGQGNSLAGMNKIRKKFGKALGGSVSKRFSGSKMQTYGGGRFRMPGVPGLRRGEDFAEGGEIKPWSFWQERRDSKEAIQQNINKMMGKTFHPRQGERSRGHIFIGDDPANPAHWYSEADRFAEGGSPQEVPIAASDGEHILSPDEVMAFGGGDMKRGHDRLDQWVLSERKKHIEQLKRLRPPKAD